jgi:hypothetical protein
MNVLFLFAPAFRELGAQVGRRLAENSKDCLVHGIYAGLKKDGKFIEDIIGESAGHLWHLQTEEESWFSKPLETTLLEQIDLELGIGAAGRILTADRSVGRGFVRGGLSRPDLIGDQANANKINVYKYLAGLYGFLSQVFEQVNPDFVFCYAVAGAPALGLYEICRARNVPFLTLTTARIHNYHVIDEGKPGQLNCIKQRYREIIDGNNVGLEREHAQARELLKDFRRNPIPPGYVKFARQRFSTANLVKNLLLAIAKTPFYPLKIPGTQETYREKVARAWFDAWISWRRLFLDRQYFSSPPQDASFIYFPLHVDPEASTMVFSPWHTDQLSVIEAIAKSLPAHMSLVVKEHFPMLGRRPPGFYRSIAQMPRVSLLSPEYSGIDLVLRSELVAVITGTAAWEAMRLRKPTLIIGDSPFMAIGEGFFHEPCLAKLPEAIVKTLELPPATDRALINYLTAGLAESFELSPSIVWGRYDKHSAEEKQRAVSDITNAILKRITKV